MNWIMECLHLANADAQAEPSVSSLFIIYTVLSALIRKPVYLLAFFMCDTLVNAEWAQTISEYQIYLMVIVIYSYIYSTCKTKHSKAACVILMIISIIFSIDAFLYGINGYHGESKTFIYDNIGSIALYAHLIFISSLINHERVWHNIQCFLASLERITNNGYNMQYIFSFINQKGFVNERNHRLNRRNTGQRSANKKRNARASE